jgi:transposase InsO family protein
VADITEFHCLDGKLHLADIRDLHDHCLVGWSMGERQTTDLVVGVLVMALARRHPADRAIHHADQGSQYTSLELTWRLADWGLVGSWGSVGDPADNAAMEASWATTKREIRHIWGPWQQKTRSQLRTVLFTHNEVSTTAAGTRPPSGTAAQTRPAMPPNHKTPCLLNRRNSHIALAHPAPTKSYPLHSSQGRARYLERVGLARALNPSADHAHRCLGASWSRRPAGRRARACE